MALQDLINELFKDYPHPINLRYTDIIEYMMLEAVDGIPYFQGKNYNCKHKFRPPYYVVNFIDYSHSKHSQIKYLQNKFVQKLGHQIIREKYSEDLDEHVLYENYKIGFDFEQSWFETTIRNSSLVRAAGDLSGLNLHQLVQLREDVSQFSMQDKTVNQLVKHLQSKIDVAIKQYPYFTQGLLDQSSQVIREGTALKRFHYEKEMQFNLIFNELESCLKPVITNGTEILTFYVGGPDSIPRRDIFESIINPNFNKQNELGKNAANALKKELKDAGDKFFSQPDQQSMSQFKAACLQAIEKAQPILDQFPIFGKTKALINTLEVVVETTVDLPSDWDALLKLKEKSGSGWMSNKTVIGIVDAHQMQIDQAIKKHPAYDQNQAEYNQLSKGIDNSKEDKKFYHNKEMEFNSIFNQLNNKLCQLINKGTEGFLKFNPKYVPAKHAAETLMKELEQARDSFFDKPDKDSLNQFKGSCLQAIQKAEPIFAQHRGYWQTHPIVTLYISILDKLLDLYAYVFKKDSIQHYRDTFFADNASTQELKSFKQKLLDEEQGWSKGLDPIQP